MRKINSVILAAFLGLFIAGCSIKVPPYQSDLKSAQSMRSNGLEQVNVKQSYYEQGAQDDISLRGSTIVSPVGSSFASYLQSALEEQLKSARLYDKNSPVTLTGIMVKNSLDGNSFTMGSATISARFVVKRDNVEVYNKVKTANHTWESSFVGAIAIPNAVNNYPTAIQKLVLELLNDSEFIEAIKLKK